LKAHQAQDAFGDFLKSRGLKLERLLAPPESFAAMLDFYREVRARKVIEVDGDMLLFQWGTHDWGEGAHFEVDLTRQLYTESWIMNAIAGGPGDHNIWQLSLRFRYAATEALAELGHGNRWCHSLEEFEAFRSFVETHPVLRAVQDLAPTQEAELSLSQP
jgi:hypothetical protein